MKRGWGRKRCEGGGRDFTEGASVLYVCRDSTLIKKTASVFAAMSWNDIHLNSGAKTLMVRGAKETVR